MRLRFPIILAVLLTALLCGGQNRDGPILTPAPNTTEIRRDPTPIAPIRRIDPARVRNRADELAKLASGIPSDIDQVGKGLLPKDLNDKLKRIEKLSKQLRQELE
jgi:hypothetical protein